MAIHLVEIITNKDGGIDTANFIDNGEGVSIPECRLREYLSSRNVENMAIVNGLFKGTQGNLARYVDYSLTVLEKFSGENTGYLVYVSGRGAVRYSNEEAYGYVKKYGATNAKAVRRAGKNSVVPLAGKFVAYGDKNRVK